MIRNKYEENEKDGIKEQDKDNFNQNNDNKNGRGDERINRNPSD